MNNKSPNVDQRSRLPPIVLDPNNDWHGSEPYGPSIPTQYPNGWRRSDDSRADEYLTNIEIVIWTPHRSGGRPLVFQPLPDFARVVDDADEFNDAVESAAAALEPRVSIAGQSQKAHRSRAMLRASIAVVRKAAIADAHRLCRHAR